MVAAALTCTAAAVSAQTSPTIPMELFVGGVRFPAEISGVDREVFGLRAGVDLGVFAGIRGVYWRGLQTGPLATGPLQGFGAEAQVNLNAGTGVTPFVVGGFTRVDFMDGFAPEGQPAPGDFTAPLVGAGLRLDLGPVGMQAALRAHFLETAERDGASSDLRTAMMATAGLTYRLGRSRGSRAAPAPGRGAQTVVTRGDTVYVISAPDTAAAPEHLITIPVPREGEIYLRYGPGDPTRPRLDAAPVGSGVPTTGAITEADLELLRRRVIADLEPVIRGALVRERGEVQELIRAELARQGTGGLSPAAEQRLLESIETVVALRVRQELGRAALAADTTGVWPVPRPLPGEATGFQPRFRGVRPYTGMNVNRPRQFLLGTRLDLGPLAPGRPQVRVLPEVVVGWGQGGVSAMMTGNLAYEARALTVSGTLVQPYAYTGFGFLFFGDPPVGRPRQEAVVNLGWGITVPMPHQGPLPRLFIEHQAVDLFDLHRVIVGLRL